MRVILNLCATAPIWAVSAVKLIRAATLIWGSDDVHQVPAIDAWDNVIESHQLLAAVLILCVVATVLGYILRRWAPPLALALFFFDAFWLALGGLGTLVAFQQVPPPPHSVSFMLADQAPQLMMIGSYIAAVVYAVSPAGRAKIAT